ncbi:hypothetical protein [Bacillus thuringiensis]|uniref:hypothetical protein n=1 Tax=Bacillus thuringiensis TaxID=1428 RepID=UPI000BFE52FA|nr:hypothetical protein [Bacillus thuringiensis]PGT89886.1 hypothetical protein COD17_09045 [Bacillus thuringiensis]
MTEQNGTYVLMSQEYKNGGNPVYALQHINEPFEDFAKREALTVEENNDFNLVNHIQWSTEHTLYIEDHRKGGEILVCKLKVVDAYQLQRLMEMK